MEALVPAQGPTERTLVDVKRHSQREDTKATAKLDDVISGDLPGLDTDIDAIKVK